MGLPRSITREPLAYQPRDSSHARNAAAALSDSMFASDRTYLIALGFALVLGAIVRFGGVLASSFPLNDGGMFMQAILDLQHSHYLLPEFIHYNGLPIPYAYPPLGFYIAGLTAGVTHASLFTVLRIIPATFSVLTLVAFMLLANSFLRNRDAVVVAALAFAFVPRSHNWEIMGGGLTRSIGFFFATLAIWQAYLLFTRRSRLALVWTSLFSALACMSHLEMAWFVVFSAVLLFLFYGRTRAGFRDAILVSLGVLLLTSPWWGVVIARHGIAPFIYAGHTGGHSIAVIFALLLTLNWGQEPLFPLFGALALAGMLYCLVRRRYFLPLWVFVGLLLDPRKFETEAMVPLSMIVGICVVEVMLPLIRQGAASLFAGESSATTTSLPARAKMRQWVGPIAVGIIVIYAMLSSAIAVAEGDVPLSVAEQQAMSWVSTSTPPTSRFAIVTGDQWASDRSSEWFPVLAGRTSAATVQGYEWLPNDAYGDQVASYAALQKCASETAGCINSWAIDEHATYNYVYVATRELQQGSIYFHVPCCSGLVASLRSDPQYHLVFQNAGAAIFERTSALAGSAAPGTAVSDRDRKQTPL